MISNFASLERNGCFIVQFSSAFSPPKSLKHFAKFILTIFTLNMEKKNPDDENKERLYMDIYDRLNMKGYYI